MDPKLLGEYGLRVAPGLALGVVFLLLVPRRNVELRLFVYVLLFVLLRDALTPLKMWELEPGSLRLPRDPALAAFLGVACGLVVPLLHVVEPDLAAVVVWVRARPPEVVLTGLAGAALVALPVLLVHATGKLPRGSEVPVATWPGILVLALLGNFLEEYLFRGWLQGILFRHLSQPAAIGASGVFFALCHAFLASTVTDAGVPLLAFVLWEGLVAAVARWRAGVVSAAIAHGLGIFVVATGIA